MFPMCFCSLLLKKRILLNILSFCVGIFFISRILLLEDFGVVSFCNCEYISFP